MGGLESYGAGADYGTINSTYLKEKGVDYGTINSTHFKENSDWLKNSYNLAICNYQDGIANTSSMIFENIYKLNCTTSATNIWSYDEKHWYTNGQPWTVPVSERIRQMIQARMAPAFHRRRTSMSIATDVREERARQTLRRIIGEQAFKKFVRNGFITVVPKSGLTYRIYPGYGITDVYDRGIMVDRLCVVLQGNFPPTDSLLMRYLLILNDEGEFSKYAVKYHVFQSRSTKLVFPAQEEVKPLTEAWAKLKVA